MAERSRNHVVPTRGFPTMKTAAATIKRFEMVRKIREALASTASRT